MYQESLLVCFDEGSDELSRSYLLLELWVFDEAREIVGAAENEEDRLRDQFLGFLLSELLLQRRGQIRELLHLETHGIHLWSWSNYRAW